MTKQFNFDPAEIILQVAAAARAAGIDMDEIERQRQTFKAQETHYCGYCGKEHEADVFYHLKQGDTPAHRRGIVIHEEGPRE